MIGLDARLEDLERSAVVRLGFVAAAAPARLGPKQLVEAVGKFLIHYPSYLVYVAIFDRLDLFLHLYVAINAAHAARSFLAITLKLGRRAP
jgi:hypothetical protein